MLYRILGNFRGTKLSRMGPFREYIFEDGPLVTIENNGKSAFRVVKISRMQANPRKQRNYFTSKISQYTVRICNPSNTTHQFEDI